ncbi:uncharacterized protein LOC122245665, partial [Penaeus japonicus]|uniref:uncharacterized protein LOC122245665 n=1 Tax=Penaeus japonicus TaxID=27405 RepID=UPI001C715121
RALPDLSLITSTLPPPPPPLADFQTHLPDLSSLPPPPATPPHSKGQALGSSALPLEWPSAPTTLPPSPPSPLVDKGSPWMEPLPDPITRSPKRELPKAEASSYAVPGEQLQAAECIDPPVSTNDAESSGSHASSQLSTYRSLSTASTIQDMARLQLSEAAVPPSLERKKEQREATHRSPRSSHMHHSHCPYATISHPPHPRCNRRVHPCQHHMNQCDRHIPPWSRHCGHQMGHCDHQLRRCGLGRSHSLPKRRSLTRSRSESPRESRPWPLTPEVNRRLSYFDGLEDEKGGMESPRNKRPARYLQPSSSITEEHRGWWAKGALVERTTTVPPHTAAMGRTPPFARPIMWVCNDFVIKWEVQIAVFAYICVYIVACSHLQEIKRDL